jgi:hypothetical protein
MLRSETKTPTPGWQQNAACRGLHADLFFERHEYAAAIQLCKTCPVLLDCGAEAWGYETGAVYFYGVRAGVPPLSRQNYHEAHRREQRRSVSIEGATGGHAA